MKLSSVCVPLFVLAVMISVSAASREDLIDAAITEVKAQFATKNKNFRVTNADKKLHSFKMSTPESQAQGDARLKFERMVKKAEKNIIEKERNAAIQSAEERVESLAMELMHKPGSILTKQEIARMYQESECNDLVKDPRPCDKTVRSADGTCNNLENPRRGAASTAMRRLIPSRYDDGVSRLQGTLQSQGLSFSPGPFSPPKPSPRVVSLGIVGDRIVNETQFSHILMQWGQFMDHDLDAIPEFEDCPSGCEVEEETCVPFPVPEDDRDVMVSRVNGDNRSCHTFRRSIPVCEESTSHEMTPREQINAITHFIDGSMVYHHNDEVMMSLIRDQNSPDGLLNVGSPASGTTRPSLPFITPEQNAEHIIACPNPPCFLAGDFRVNEHVSLTVMHTLWVREHNRIAMGLRRDTLMSSDDIFYLARDIVISEIQKITYKDFLPILLGDSYSSLIPPYSGYNEDVVPNIPNAFATAAYRFGHSQIQPFFDRLDSNYESIPAGPLSLVDSFFDASQFLNNGGTDPILRGLLTKPARKVDEFLNSVLTSRLFSDSSSVPGLDLASLNVQRGRDHGLPPYITWKQWAGKECGVESDFLNQLTSIHFQQTYGSLDNVDLFVAGLAEERLSGGLVGAVFACIFGNTFTALRDGDRFYYENSDPETALFSEAQRQEIEKASLSRVICDNTDIDEIQQNAFVIDETNSRNPCSEIPSMDLTKWNQFKYVKVTSERRKRRLAFLAFSNIPGTEDILVERTRSGCMKILNPESEVTVVLTTTTSCRVRPNENLEDLTAVFDGTGYLKTFSASEIQPENGFYTTLEECNRGRSVAATFCPRREDADTQIVNGLEDLLESDVEIEGENENIDKLVSDPEVLKGGLSENLIKKILPSTMGKKKVEKEKKVEKDKKEELISVMEEVLQQLKSNQAQSQTIPSVAEASTKEDNIISELEDALKKEIQ